MWMDFIARFEPEERLFWPYLVSALLIAVVGACFGRVDLRRDVFSGAIWWHPSARADYGFFFVRIVLAVLLIGPLLLSSTVVAVKVVLALFAALGEAPRWPLGRAATTALYTACLFVAADGSRWVVHWLAHEVPFLWRFHQVHHSAEVLTPVTVFRTHPVEGLIMASRGVLVTGFVAGVFSWFTRGQAVPADVLGINAVAFALNLVGSNLRHSHVWLTFGPLERFLLSPAQHQLHHDASNGGHHVNYGSFIALWDRLAGSWVPAVTRPAAFGVPAAQLNHSPRSAWSLLVGPFLPRRPLPTPADPGAAAPG